MCSWLGIRSAEGRVVERGIYTRQVCPEISKMRKSLQLEESYKSLISVLHAQVTLETENACYSAGAVVPGTQFLTFMRGVIAYRCW